MAEGPPGRLREEGWSVERAEELVRTLPGVVSVRVVANLDREVEEIHVLTTEEVGPKQTVRNVESALLAHLDKVIDHRTISVAQTTAGAQGGNGGVNRVPGRLMEERILFLGVCAAEAQEQDGSGVCGDVAGRGVARDGWVVGGRGSRGAEVLSPRDGVGHGALRRPGGCAVTLRAREVPFGLDLLQAEAESSKSHHLLDPADRRLGHPLAACVPRPLHSPASWPCAPSRDTCPDRP